MIMNQYKHGGLPFKVYDFVIEKMNKIDSFKKDLIKETQQLFPNDLLMVSAQDQCEHMKFILKLIKAKNGIEIGTFTGYSAICLAEALPDDGKLICLDINENYIKLAKKYFQIGKLDHKIQVNIGPANNYLDFLLSQEKYLNSFDFAYVDADKQNYTNYYNKLIPLLRQGGIIFFDNIIWSGMVADEKLRQNDLNTKSIFEVNQIALNDPRVQTHTITLGDGLMIIEKL